jgi:hypothetical protein
MKVTNWRRTLAASLVAGGLLSPSAAYAADLNTNLIPDPQFDMLTDPPVQCCFGQFQLDSWNDGTQLGFAYDNTVSLYDSGGPLAGGGTHYFSSGRYSGGDPPDVTMPGQVSENIDVSTGATLSQIESGEAVVRLSAFFTSYGSGQSTHNTEGDRGFVHVDFLNAGATSLGTAEIGRRQPAVNGWDQNTGAFPVPVGTRTLKVSLYGAAASTGPDGYIDVVDVQVRAAADELLFLEVNATTGQVAIKNQTGEPFRIDHYEITAPGTSGDYNRNGVVDAADYVVWRDNLDAEVTLPNDSTPGMVTIEDYNVWRANFGREGSLDAVDWDSLQEPANNPAGFPAGTGTGNGWEQSPGSDANKLSESYLTGNSLVSNGASIPLGAAFNPGSMQNLEFRYAVVPDNGMGAFVGPGALVKGFVRYVTSGSGTVVPEPSSVLLLGIGLASLVAGGRKSTGSCKE